MAEVIGVYDPDDVGSRDSPPLKALKVNLTPSPSPPLAAPLPQVSPDSRPGSPGCKGSNRQKNRPSQGDAVLVSFMDGGKRPEIARLAGAQPLASDGEEEEESVKGPVVNVSKDGIDELTALAANAMMKANEQASPDTIVKIEIKTSEGELPPILPQSQPNLSNGRADTPKVTLPSISDQLGDQLNHIVEPTAAANFPFAQSPPGQPGSPPFSVIPSQESPPKSPYDAFHHQLPLPRRGNILQRPLQADGGAPSPNTEIPSTNQLTPTMPIDQMSINNITNPQIDSSPKFQCTYPGCTAQPFQTQYLLNSHANVHSSNRPHYCSVNGCPRSEGGKGFKRKNEMIRHGLVHNSPGYVCPFCPDKEHKYPRPDNLQRHVRVHHIDKDKDDAQLREVLSQRPEGPSRGRRRRGGTS